MALRLLALMLLLPQAPDDGWGLTRVQPREVKRIYWELLQTTEVLVASSRSILTESRCGSTLSFRRSSQGARSGIRTRGCRSGRKARQPDWS